MSGKLLIYGAYGYTGRLIAIRAAAKGLNPVVAGRDTEKTRQIAEELGLEWISFSLSNPSEIRQNLEDVRVLLNCAGPFSQTAQPLMEACIEKHVHYSDITGEIQVFELANKLSQRAKEAGIVLLPGVGFDVVPSDCLAAYVASKLPDSQKLELAFMGGAGFSRGTALTMAENVHLGGAIRKNGKIVTVPHAFKTKYVRFEDKERLCVTIPWGDVSTGFYSTGIPNISVFISQPPAVVRLLQTADSFKWLLGWKPVQLLIKKYIRKSVHGPTSAQRETGKSMLHAVVENEQGARVEARLQTPEGYQLTAITAVMAAENLLKGVDFAGFKTPSLAFGHGFILQAEGVKLYD